MENTNYKFILADDHNGNKALTIIKGSLTNYPVKKAVEITDPKFSSTANQLIKLFNQISAKTQDGEK